LNLVLNFVLNFVFIFFEFVWSLEFGAWNLFGIWCLVLGICLEFGAWNLEFPRVLVLGAWNFPVCINKVSLQNLHPPSPAFYLYVMNFSL